jgi:glycosyltransferase involved in cell wall biosynthesis
MTDQQLISFILPIYNQADHIGAIVDEYESVLARVPAAHELLLVINGSRDNSLEVCQALAEKNKSIRIIFSEKGGWGLAVKLGLQEAQGDWVCYTNSARTSPQDILLFSLYAIANPGTVIKANRKVRENWQRRLGSLLYNIECRTLLDLSFWDVNGTPKIFPRTFDKLLHLTHEDDLIDAEFNLICRREAYPMLEVPVFSTRRHGGRSTTHYGSALRMYLGIYQMWREADGR